MAAKENASGGAQKIGVLYGMESTFPPALMDRINSRAIPGIVAEPVRIGAVRMAEPCAYRVVIDRISHDIPFYRAWLKNAVLGGTVVVNNPFWWSADDKFFNYSLANKIGIAVPRTVLLPHKAHPPGTTERSMRNLIYPLNWDDIFEYIGFPAFLKPFSGGGWKNVYRVDSPEEFFRAYDDTGDLCMTLQRGVDFKEYFRCFVVGQNRVRVMQYDPRQPHACRYLLNPSPVDAALVERVESDARKLCAALGYDLNTVEFAVEDGIPWAIDFLNPAPDADYHSVGPDHFEWIVNAVADLAIEKVRSQDNPAADLRWSAFLRSSGMPRVLS
jgi:glutathione synthase/RimK-type ligase-like ATP-grasp enzyme